MKIIISLSVLITLCALTFFTQANEDKLSPTSSNNAVVTGWTYCEIHGIQKYAGKFAVSNVTVLFRDTNGKTNAVISNTGGFYRITLPPGTYNTGWFMQYDRPESYDPFRTNTWRKPPAISLVTGQVQKIDLLIYIEHVD